ncbi:MAG TPA: hypothetical protein VLF90_02455 [Patescibacteria group bacterium]|nr:hypothetical protein [Patescibacteria group bacterium]
MKESCGPEHMHVYSDERLLHDYADYIMDNCAEFLDDEVTLKQLQYSLIIGWDASSDVRDQLGVEGLPSQWNYWVDDLPEPEKRLLLLTLLVASNAAAQENLGMLRRVPRKDLSRLPGVTRGQARVLQSFGYYPDSQTQLRTAPSWLEM